MVALEASPRARSGIAFHRRAEERSSYSAGVRSWGHGTPRSPFANPVRLLSAVVVEGARGDPDLPREKDCCDCSRSIRWRALGETPLSSAY